MDDLNTAGLAERLQEMGEHPCRAHLPMGADLREVATALTAQAAEIARLKARLNWLANETMACDYGDNDHGAVAWNFHTYRGVKTSIIGASIDAAIDAALTGSQSHD